LSSFRARKRIALLEIGLAKTAQARAQIRLMS
jgi:hypothetical protein